MPDTDVETQRKVVDAFVAAARDGDFGALLEVLDPDVVLRVDYGGAAGLHEVRGAEAVAAQASNFSQLGLVMVPALVNGVVGGVAFRDGKPFSVGAITVRDGRIVELDFLNDRKRLEQLDLTILED